MNAPAASPLVFQALTPHRAFEDIAGQIRAQVASGNLKPGDRLPPERELAALFQVSRSMIEARKGANGGAFVLPGNSGVVVRGMSDLYHLGAITPEHLTEARIWLSELVVRVVCERGSDEDIQALEANVARAAQADADNDFEERQRLHRQFHLILAKATRNPIIEITMEGVMELMGLFVARIGPSENAFTLPSRRRLISCLRARHAEGASREMAQFLERMQAHYLTLWNERR